MVLGVFWIVLLAPMAWSQESQGLLRYQFPAYAVIDATTILDVTGVYYVSSSEIPEITATPSPARYSLEIARRFRILESNAQGALIQEEILGVREPSSASGEMVFFDKDVDQTSSPLFRQMKGVARYRITPRGEVSRAPDAEAEPRREFGTWMGGVFFLFPILPTEPIEAGTAWTDERILAAVPSSEPVAASMTATLETSEGNAAIIRFIRTLSARNVQHTVASLPQDVTSVTEFRLSMKALNMRTSGTAEIDLNNGRLLGLNENIQFTADTGSRSSIYEFPLRIDIRQVAGGTRRTTFRYR